MAKGRPYPSASETVLARRELLLGSLMIGAATLSFVRLPRTQIVGLTQGSARSAIPRRFGRWIEIGSQDDIVMPPEDERKAASIYDEQVMRTYQNESSQKIMLLVAYARSQDSMLMIHRPESCYPGSGFTIVSNDVVQIPLVSKLSIKGRFLTTELDSRVEQVLYWTRFGNQMPVDWDDQRWSIASQALQGMVPDGALVRMSIISTNASLALATLKEFAKDLVNNAGTQGRGLLLGPANREIGMA